MTQLQPLSLATLAVYLSPTCPMCDEASRIIQDITPDFPNVDIGCFNINGDGVPDNVFAAPTYVLNGKVIFLGNPTRAGLRAKLADVVHNATKNQNLGVRWWMPLSTQPE